MILLKKVGSFVYSITHTEVYCTPNNGAVYAVNWNTSLASVVKQMCIANDVVEENSIAVKLLSERIMKERMIIDEALVRNQEKKQTARGSSKDYSVGSVLTAVVQLRKQENNCFRLTVHCTVFCLPSDVLKAKMTDLHSNLYSADKIRAANETFGF